MGDKFEKGTGRDIHAWMEFIQEHEDGAADLSALSHQQLAALASAGGASDWWAQGIAVEIERLIGRRAVGQTVTGSVNAGASKTVPGEWTEVFDLFVAFMEAGGSRLLTAELIDAPRISHTDKWRYWRASLVDGSVVAIDCSESNGKTRLSVKHDKLGSLEEREPAKVHWRGVLKEFAELLASQ